MTTPSKPFRFDHYLEMAWRIDTFHYWFIGGLIILMTNIREGSPRILYLLFAAGVPLIALSMACYVQKLITLCRLIREEVIRDLEKEAYIKLEKDTQWRFALSMGVSRWRSPLIFMAATAVFLFYMTHFLR